MSARGRNSQPVSRARIAQCGERLPANNDPGSIPSNLVPIRRFGVTFQVKGALSSQICCFYVKTG